MDALTSDAVVLARLALAALLGAAVGWERESAGKEAGLRTMTLVSGGSALFTMIAGSMLAGTEAGRSGEADPVRVVQAIAIGIGFLGAGAVRVSDRIVGLTTAAAIWAAAAIGIAAAVGRYVVAVGATLLFLFVLRVLVFLEPASRKAVAPGEQVKQE